MNDTVEKNGKSRFIMENADYDLNDPNFMALIKRMMKKEGLTQEEAIEKFKGEVTEHNVNKKTKVGESAWSEPTKKFKAGGLAKRGYGKARH
jgi:hypothetical protein|tara:strand:+ start:338 stop:613 length:276 start_codon:yes stop_codon:yes gene_type:complete